MHARRRPQTLIADELWPAPQMTRLFLNDMIRQRRGHIVGVASGFGLYPCGRGVTYTTSKFAVRGFMMSLNEELCYNNHSQYIKTTTIYPLFMATREELTDTWRKLRCVVSVQLHSHRRVTLVQWT